MTQTTFFKPTFFAIHFEGHFIQLDFLKNISGMFFACISFYLTGFVSGIIKSYICTECVTDLD